MKNLLCSFFLLFLLGVWPLWGESGGKWLPMQLSNEDGLSNSAITSIFRDSEGLLWFGSWDGLNRYDGNEIRVFKPNIFEEHSLSNNIIRDIFEDSNRNLWVVTNRGINRYSRHTMDFTSYFSGDEYFPVREQNLKSCIGPDSALYISLSRFGLYRYDEGSADFRELRLPGLSDSDHKNILGLTGNGNGRLYILEQGGRVVCMEKKESFVLVYDHEPGGVEDLDLEKHWFLHGTEHAYLAVALQSGGLFILNLDTRESTRVREHEEGFRVTTLNASLEEGCFWVGTDGGSVGKLYPETEPRIVLMDEHMRELTSARVKIWTIKQFSSDLLWIGTDGKGVFRYLTQGNPFFSIRKGSPQSASLGHNIVRAVMKDPEDRLWVGTRGNGLNMLPAGEGPRISYTTANGLSNNAVLSLRQDKSGNIWIGVDGEGIHMLEHSSGRILHFPEDFVNAGEEEFGYVYAIYIDVYGRIWLGTSGYGVVSLTISRDSNGRYSLDNYRQLRFTPGTEGLKSNIVYSIVEERPNVLWLGTRGGGLYRLNTVNNKMEHFGITGDREQGLIDNDILSLCMCESQKLWIGTSGGLSLMNLSYRPYGFTHYTENSGMPNNTVHGILQDSLGNIWASTNSGLCKLDVAKGTFQNYNRADGLANTEYADGAFFNDTLNKVLYFGGMEGLDWFRPADIVPSSHYPPVFLNEFRLNNSAVIPGDSTGILERSLNATGSIDLNHRQNFFSITYTSLNYINPDKCQFAYRLEGFDRDWNEVGNQRMASFTNVPPGKYRFMIRASNEDGLYGPEIRVIDLIIHPPFWNTVPAYILYFFLLLGVALVLLRAIKQRARQRRMVEMEKMERLQAEEINRYKLQFFTDVAHEFRTPLTLILAPAAMLDEKLDGETRLGRYARAIYQNAHRLQKLISELIEFRKVETNNMQLSVGKYDLVLYISKLIGAFEIYTRIHNLELNFIHRDSQLEAWIDPEKFEKILVNLVSNAVKYTPEGGSIELELLRSGEEIRVIVRDTGSGIPEELLERIFDRFYHHGKESHGKESPGKDIYGERISRESGGVGLALTRSLVHLHKGTITVENRPAGGAEFCVCIPAGMESYEGQLAEGFQKPSTRKIALRVEEELPSSRVFDSPADGKDADGKGAERKGPDGTNAGEARASDSRMKYSLLLVDDNPEVNNLVESLLSDEYGIFKASDGNAAMEILGSESVDLVISDILMPGMDGLTLTKRIKSDIQTSHIPVILLTAKTEITDRIEGLEVGADSYIPKPFHPRHLQIRVEKLIANSEKLRSSFSEYHEGQNRPELPGGLSPGDDKLINGLIDYIGKHMQDPELNADALARKMAMSKTQLYRKIKALSGLTPHGLINSLRLRKAASELIKGEKNVSEVFYETGFNSRSYFYEKFKEAYGVTPKEYTGSRIA